MNTQLNQQSLTRRGQLAYAAGKAAEYQVADDYARRGHPLMHDRWRGRSGEIDLIAEDGDGLIFIEVKKSRSFDAAAQRVTARQQARIYHAAAEFLEHMPKGQLTNVRFDVALVNQNGEIHVIENAFGHH